MSYIILLIPIMSLVACIVIPAPMKLSGSTDVIAGYWSRKVAEQIND
jgi:hypothetical protein